MVRGGVRGRDDHGLRVPVARTERAPVDRPRVALVGTTPRGAAARAIDETIGAPLLEVTGRTPHGFANRARGALAPLLPDATRGRRDHHGERGRDRVVQTCAETDAAAQSAPVFVR